MPDVQFLIFLDHCVNAVRLETLGHASLQDVSIRQCLSSSFRQHILDHLEDLIRNILNPAKSKDEDQSYFMRK